MADTEFFCSSCGARLTADTSEAGRTFPCPKCGTELTVPTASALSVSEIEFFCSNCGAKLGAEETDAGKAVPCPQCGTKLTVPARTPDAQPSPRAKLGLARTSQGPVLPAAGQSAGAGPRPCPSCRKPLPANTIVCMNCGFNTATGESVMPTSGTSQAGKATKRVPSAAVLQWSVALAVVLVGTVCLGFYLRARVYGGIDATNDVAPTTQANEQRTVTSPDGAKYVGGFKDGNYNGQGTLTFPDGKKCTGEWRNGKQNGQGTTTCPDGRAYVGGFVDGLWSGQGTLTLPSGTKYVGEFGNGQYNGQGSVTFADGTRYVGAFKDGTPYGQGTATLSSGTTLPGRFENGKFVPSQSIAKPAQQEEAQEEVHGLGATPAQCEERYGKHVDVNQYGGAVRYGKNGFDLFCDFRNNVVVRISYQVKDRLSLLDLPKAAELVAKNSQGKKWSKPYRTTCPLDISGSRVEWAREDGGVAMYIRGGDYVDLTVRNPASPNNQTAENKAVYIKMTQSGDTSSF